MIRLSRTLLDFKVKAMDTFENYNDEAYISLVRDRIIEVIKETAEDRVYSLAEEKICKILEESLNE